MKKIQHSSQNFIFLIIYLIILFKTLNENIMKANKKINKLLFVTQNLVIIINGHANFVHIFTKLGSWYHWVFDFFTLQIVYLWKFNFLCIEIQLKNSSWVNKKYFKFAVHFAQLPNLEHTIFSCRHKSIISYVNRVDPLCMCSYVNHFSALNSKNG